MARFDTHPSLMWVGGKRPWELIAPLRYHSDIMGSIIVPAGFATDLASVPRIPLIYWRVGGRAVLPAIVHDWLYYECHGIKRSTADRVFLEAMNAAHDPPWILTRWLMYLGVRLGGWRGWYQYRREVRA